MAKKRRIKNTKAKGSRRETALRDEAYNSGALLVMKSAASLGPADLMIAFPRACILAQAKGNRWPSCDENLELDELASKLDARLYIVLSIRIDDGKPIPGRGAICAPPTMRCRLHRGPGVPVYECTWAEVAAAVRADGLQVLRGVA